MDSGSCADRQQEGFAYGALIQVVIWGAVFMIAEHLTMRSNLPPMITRLFARNPSLKENQIKDSIPMVATRLVGFLHNTVQVPIAIWVISHPELRIDRLHATTDLSHVMLCIAGGFFLHDAVCCLLRESPFYVVHGLTCCLGYVAAAMYGSGHFYGGLFLLWEMSTPFVQLRWVLHKMALADTGLYMANNLFMAGTFTLVRVVFGTYFTFLMVSDARVELTTEDKSCVVPTPLILGLCSAAVIISCLNYYWFSLMMKSLVKIYLKGQSWSQASAGKEE